MSTNLIEQKVGDNLVFSLSPVLSKTLKSFCESGHNNNEVFNYGAEDYVIRSNYLVPSLIKECLPTGVVMVVPRLSGTAKKFTETQFVETFKDILGKRAFSKASSYEYVYQIASKKENAVLYLSRRCNQRDYYDDRPTGDHMLNVFNMFVVGALNSIRYSLKKDTDGNPYVFINLSTKEDIALSLYRSYDNSKQKCQEYLSRISPEFSFIPVSGENYKKVRESVGAIDLMYSALVDIVSDAVIDTLETITESPVDSYFSDSWRNSGIMFDNKTNIYFKGVGVPAGRVVGFEDSDSGMQFVGELKADTVFFPKTVSLVKTKPNFEKLVAKSALLDYN